MDILTAVLVVLSCCLYGGFVKTSDANVHYVNEWAAHIKGGESVAKRVAEQHGYQVERKITGFDDHYLLKRSDVPHRSRRSADHHTKRISEDERVHFVEQQYEKHRVKRGMKYNRELANELATAGANLDDPDLTAEWYLNKGSRRRDLNGADLRVKDCWKKGLSGKGVVVSILDDGIEKNHTDLQLNYDPDASYDMNNNDPDPQPRYDRTNENKHGTRCAGEVAMMANNNKCGVGIAFNAKIGGIRMLDGRVTDRLEAESLAFHSDHIDIYSASWGPNDDGKTTEKPGKMVSKALENGVTKGRGGKGSLFVWAGGNGGVVGDNCNSDGYTSSIYTFSVNSATQFGNSPWYSEKCSSTLVSAYSSGDYQEGKVVSTDLHDLCTTAHSGTSAAAPMAAGVLALVLESNPDLTWRDVQHIAVHTARMEPLALERGWYKNGAGYCVNIRFGFGLIDALGMVELADPKTWKGVGEQHSCEVAMEGLSRSFSAGENIEVEVKTDGCQGQMNEINYLEHVILVLDLNATVRGHIYAELESPMGTITPLMLTRKEDKSKDGFVEWPLMSVHTWGEQPQGTWKFRVADRGPGSSATLIGVKLVMYGTQEKPAYQNGEPKDCGNVENFAEIYSKGDNNLKKSLTNILAMLEDTPFTQQPPFVGYNQAEREDTTPNLVMDSLKSILNSPVNTGNPHLQSALTRLEEILKNKMVAETQKQEIAAWFGRYPKVMASFNNLYKRLEAHESQSQ